MKLHDLKTQHTAILDKADAVIDAAAGRGLSASEQTLVTDHIAEAKTLRVKIDAIESTGSLAALMRTHGGAAIITGVPETHGSVTTFSAPGEVPACYGVSRRVCRVGEQCPFFLGRGSSRMEATNPSGPISVGSGSGLDSIAITIPTTILPYLASYYNLDSFGLAGATQFFTDHTRPLTKPIMSAGAPASVIAENAAATTAQPFGLSGFTFGGTKYERLVLASYEALMNSELPLQGAIFDELLATLANTLTAATTTSFVAALTGASSTLEVGAAGSGGSIYTSMIDLRHAVPPRFDLPTNKWMLSRATLAQIRNTQGEHLRRPDVLSRWDDAV